MASSEQCQYDFIHRIHRDVVQSANYLAAKAENTQKMAEQILNYKSQIEQLQSQFEAVKEGNKDARREIDDLINRRIQIDEQSQQIKKLIEVFQKNNSEFGNMNLGNLDESVEKNVESIVEKIVNNIKDEFQIANKIDFENEFKKYCELKDKIDNEIFVLKEVDGEWVNDDESVMNIINDTENCCFNKNQFQHISNLLLHNNKVNIEYENTKINFEDSKVQFLKDEYEKIVQLSQINEKTISTLTSSQYNFLKILKDILNDDKIDDNLQLVEQCIIDRLKIMSQVGEISPLTFQNSVNENEQLNLVQNIPDQLSSFYNKLIENDKYKSLEQDVFKLAKDNLQVPSFEFPQEPKYQEKTIQNNKLIELSEKLKEINEQTKQMIPLQVVKSLTSSFKESYSMATNEYVYEPIDDITSLPLSTFKHQKNKIFNDNKEYELLKNSLESKIPMCSSENLTKPQFTLQIPDFTQEIKNNVEINKNDEILEEKSTNGTTEKLNFLLRAMLSIDLPPMPTIGQIQTRKESIQDIDSITPILNATNKCFETDLYKKQQLISEINNLNMQLKKLQNSFDDDFEEDFADENDTEIDSLNAKIEEKQKEIERKQQQYLETKNAFLEVKLDIETKMDEINNLPKVTENIDTLKNEIYQKKIQLNEKKKKLEPET